MVHTEGRLPICRAVGDCVGMHPQKLVTGVQLLLRRRLSKVVTVRLRGAADSTAYTSPNSASTPDPGSAAGRVEHRVKHRACFQRERLKWW